MPRLVHTSRFKIILLAALILMAGAVAFLIYFSEPFIEKQILSGIQKGVGVPVKADYVDFDLDGDVIIRGLKIMQPKEFPAGVFIDLPEVNAQADVMSFVGGESHLLNLYLLIENLYIVKNREGEVNLSILSEGEGGLSMDWLQLEIKKIHFKDYSVAEEGVTQTFDVDIEKEYHNLESLGEIGNVIGVEALFNSALSRLLSPQDLIQENVLDPLTYANKLVTGSVSQVEETATGIVGGAVDILTAPFQSETPAEDPSPE